MLSPEDNETLCRTGLGTPMGDLFRRFWLPVLLKEELPGPDCPPVRVRVLGERLVAFRDSSDRIGLLDEHCAHRGTSLFFGRNEEGGLRCVYHGWKYDVTGACVDQPNEPPERRFAHKIKLRAYPGTEHGGVIWAYLGPKDLQPELPAFEWARLPVGQRSVTKRLQETNWAQAVEGGIDSSHVSFLHSAVGGVRPGANDGSGGQLPDYMQRDPSPRFFVKETDYGLLVGARRNADEARCYWRITQFLLPSYTMIPVAMGEGNPMSGHCWVPADDEHVWAFSFTWRPDRPFTPAEWDRAHDGTGIHCQVDERHYPLRNKGNDYLIDREVQRTRTYTGIYGISEQDMASQESMGPVADRTSERLGTTDTAIISFRRLLLGMARDLQEGVEPLAARNGGLYHVRAGSLLLDRDVPFDEGAKEVLKARV